jgi:3-deoxy-manno-octulosonate cytidylyltransferase (CMP-KDO synthetase)
MAFTVLIPARYASTRLPGKPLADIAGKPMVVRVAERAMKSAAARVVVATDHASVRDACERHGIEVCMTREDHPTGTDRLAEAAAALGLADGDIVVNVQGDEPFMRADAMAGAIAMVRDHGFALGTAAGKRSPEILADPNCVKVVRADDGRALYFSRSPIPYLRDAADAPLRDGLLLQHMGIYAARREALQQWVSLPPHPLELIEKLEQLRALAAGLAMGVAIVDAPSWGEVNTEDDLVRANAHWASLANTTSHAHR